MFPRVFLITMDFYVFTSLLPTFGFVAWETSFPSGLSPAYH